MSSHYPLVSICIPTYNGAKYLGEALDSAISQTYRPLEIVISDDNSEDNSLKIAKSFIGKSDIPISIYLHEPAGIGSNWNNCVAKSNGEYIKFLFQDDKLERACIEKMLSYFENDASISLVVCGRDIIVEKGLSNAYEMWAEKWLELYSNLFDRWPIKVHETMSGNELLKSVNISNLLQNKFGEPTCTLIKKKDILNVGGFDTHLKQSLDVEAWYRLIRDRKVVFIRQNLALFRLHDKQETYRNCQTNLQERRVAIKKIFLSLINYLPRRTKLELYLEINVPCFYTLLKKTPIKAVAKVFSRIIS
jgi:glycosyltransferase involved in cell wall biosynthesis